jgi:hypothetical protein
MMRCINALSSAHFARNDPKTPLTNGEQGTKEECQYVKNVPISTTIDNHYEFSNGSGQTGL